MGAYRKQSILAWGMIAVFALPWALAPSHFLSAHRWCPTHRQVEDLHGTQYEGLEHPDLAAENSIAHAATLSKDKAPSEDSDHEACKILASLHRKDQKQQVFFYDAFAIAEMAAGSPVVNRELPFAIQVLLLAPKHSPPFVA